MKESSYWNVNGEKPGTLHFGGKDVGALVFGIEPEVNFVLFYRETILQEAVRGARRDILIALHGSADHIFLKVVHI